MTVRKLTFAILFSVVSFALSAQDAAMAPYRSFTPKDQTEIGIDLGVPLVVGDIDTKIGFGGGVHVRKALDHIFSIRAGILYAKGKNENAEGPTTTSDLSWFSGDAQMVVALNNFRFDKPVRKILLNGFIGVGVDNFSTDYVGVTQAGTTSTTGKLDATTNFHVSGGVGIAFRVSPKFNIGIENTTYVVFGKNSDLLDSDQNVRTSDQSSVTSFRDLLHYPHLSLNFNIGGKNKDGSMKSEPLYWANPLAQVSDAITALEARPIYDPTDTDADGIIDAIDEEDNSPAGARVDTKGVSLDSDGDKVLDYQDKEPYSPPGYRVDAMGVAQVPKPISEADVNRIVDAKIAAIKFPEPKGGDWFLPMVTFNDNRYDLRYSEYEKLYQVATVLKLNPALKVVVIGAADKRGSEQYNNVLSYNRAKAAIDFLVAQHGIARERLILNWVGEGSTIVPEEGSIMQNRRVEFRVAKGETEMARPEGKEAGKTSKKGSFKGNKDAGY